MAHATTHHRPLASSSSTSAPATLPATLSKSLTITCANQLPISILLVDDDADCRMLIRDAIAECRVSNHVYEVGDGAEALKFLNRQGAHADAPRPGLIFMDIEMP